MLYVISWSKLSIFAVPFFVMFCSAFGSTYVCSGSSGTFLSLPFWFIYAVFFIFVPSANLFTVTLNSRTFSCPIPTVKLIPFAKSFAVLPSLATSSIFILPSTNVVPVGTVSFTITLPSLVPSFLTFILYVISSPSKTLFPLDGVLSLWAKIFGFVTFVVTLFVSSLSSVAWFSNVLLNTSFAKTSTIPANVTSTVPFAGTSTGIPFFKFCSVYTVPTSPTWISVFLSNVKPAGNVSLNVTVFARFPSFFILTVYVTFSPSVASLLSTNFSLLIIALYIVLSWLPVTSSLVFSGVNNLIFPLTLLTTFSWFMSNPTYTTLNVFVTSTVPSSATAFVSVVLVLSLAATPPFAKLFIFCTFSFHVIVRAFTSYIPPAKSDFDSSIAYGNVSTIVTSAFPM